MEVRKLTQILRGTIDPNQRISAEEQLRQIHKIIGFAPTLLQVILANDVEIPVRQAGAVYLKNMITQSWVEKEIEAGVPMPFSVHEQDRGLIRDAIVEAVIHSPEIIKSQLAVCVLTIVKNDFPGRWTQIVDKISIYLQNPDGHKIYGALICLLQLVKNYEHKKSDHRAPLEEAMILLLPMLRNLMLRVVPDSSEQSAMVQKLVMKIFFSLIKFNIPLKVITREVFSQWMEIITGIIDRPVPSETNDIDEEERAHLPWWKCKKWAMHILERLFDRYGNTSGVMKEYKFFANWYIKTFSSGVIEVLLRVLDLKRKKQYVAPKVMQDVLSYLTITVNHAYPWSLLKVHINGIIQEVIFPLLCHTNEDETLWETDPQEYIRLKFDIYGDVDVSCTYQAQELLHTACKKRKGVLPNTLQFILHVLQTPNAHPQQKDGVLAMTGSIVDILLKKKMYRTQMEKMLCVYVFPEFSSPHGYMRARACWTLSRSAENQFQEESVKLEACSNVIRLLLTDKECRVKLEAAMALNSLLTYQETIKDFAQPEIKNITLELLKIISETKSDDATNVLQKVICMYPQAVTAVAVEICQHLATTFSAVMAENDGADDGEYSITSMSILNTMETLLSIIEEEVEVLAQIRPIVLQVACHILTQNIVEFFEEALSLIYELTCKEIPVELWKVLELIYEIFQKDGHDYFMDMMPTLHNYITVDTNAFLSNENYLLAIYNMCKTVLTSDIGEDPECHAAKLLEVIILQCKGRIDQCIPIFVELVLQRLTREIKTSELRIMCLQVVIAALYYNPPLLLETLNKLQLPIPSNESITSQFIRQWIHDADCFLGLHDRKICVLGLCTLMMLPDKPAVLNEYAQHLIPSLIILFQGLKRAYAVRAQELSEEDSDSDDEDSADEPVPLSSDEDENDEEGERYLNSLQNTRQQDDSDDSDDDDAYDAPEETPLESYTTPLDEEDEVENNLDEYVYFKEVLLSLQERDPSFYNALTATLNGEQQKQLQDIIILADQRKAAAESKKIEQRGGYSFVQQSVPSSFNFGGSPLGQ